jgi:hypothetical protein
LLPQHLKFALNKEKRMRSKVRVSTDALGWWLIASWAVLSVAWSAWVVMNMH